MWCCDCKGFLQKSAILTGSALLLFPMNLPAQVAELKSQWLSDRAVFIQGPDFNVLAVQGSEGIVLVDGGHADFYDPLRRILDEHFPGTPIRALINTHWHPGQTGANVPLGQEGVEIIAHENTMLWLSTEIWQRWSGEVYKPLPDQALPTTTVFDDGMLELGDLDVHFGYMMNAHTDGDIWVYFEQEDVLVTGGPVSNCRWPEIDWWTGGFIGGFLDGYVSLLTVPNENTRIIPACGDIMSREDLEQQNQMYLTIFDRFHHMFIDSSSLEEVLAARLTIEYDERMGDPTEFLTLSFNSIQGRLRDPQNFRILNIP